MNSVEYLEKIARNTKDETLRRFVSMSIDMISNEQYAGVMDEIIIGIVEDYLLNDDEGILNDALDEVDAP